MNTIRVLWVVVFVCAAQLASASVITITSSSVVSRTKDYAVGGAEGYASDTSTTDGSPSPAIANHGTSSSTTSRTYQSTTTGDVLEFNYAHSRAGTSNSYAQSNVSVEFTANGNYTYTLSGAYSSDLASYMSSNVSLYNFTTNTSLVWLNHNVVGTSITLGNSVTGTLDQGSEYQLSFTRYIKTYPSADSGAKATGSLIFNLSPVPIPAAAWLFGTALAGLGVARRYKCL